MVTWSRAEARSPPPAAARHAIASMRAYCTAMVPESRVTPWVGRLLRAGIAFVPLCWRLWLRGRLLRAGIAFVPLCWRLWLRPPQRGKAIDRDIHLVMAG